MDTKILEAAIKAVENSIKHKGTHLTDTDMEKIKSFGKSVRNKKATFTECKEILELCKIARIESKQKKR